MLNINSDWSTGAGARARSHSQKKQQECFTFNAYGGLLMFRSMQRLRSQMTHWRRKENRVESRKGTNELPFENNNNNKINRTDGKQ